MKFLIILKKYVHNRIMGDYTWPIAPAEKVEAASAQEAAQKYARTHRLPAPTYSCCGELGVDYYFVKHPQQELVLEVVSEENQHHWKEHLSRF